MRPRTSKLEAAALWTSLALLTAASLPAQPLLNPVDTFHGVPFISADRLTLSADGDFLYAAQSKAGLSVFQRQADGESFQLLTSYFPRGNASVIPRVGEFVATPDQAHLYVASDSTGALAVLERDPESGLLTAVQTLVSGDEGLPTFSTLWSLAFSPLGDFLYITVGDSVAYKLLAFERNPATGTLSFAQEVSTTASSPLFGAATVLVSPDGEHLYTLGDPVVSTFDRDPSTGQVSFVEAIDFLADGTITLVFSGRGAISLDGSTLHLSGANPCYNSCRREALAVLRRDPVSGKLAFLEIAPESIRFFHATLATSPDGNHAYVVDEDLGRARISTFSRRADGRLEPQGELVSELNVERAQITSLGFDATGTELYASGFEGRPLSRFRRDPATGDLLFEAPSNDSAEAITGPSDLAISPDGEHLYVAGNGSSAIASFTWDDATGTLAPLDAFFTTDLGIESFLSPRWLQISPDGSRLYAVDEGRSLLAFARDEDGNLDFLSPFDSSAVGSLFGLAISPAGEHLYLFGYFGIAALSRDPLTDELTLIQSFEQATSFQHAVPSSDGRHLYTLGNFECGSNLTCRALMTVKRDPESGTLTLRDTLLSLDSTQFEELNAATLSPDGQHLYLSTVLDTVPVMAVFDRNPIDGSLELLQVMEENEPGADLSYSSRRLQIAPDGRHLYSPRATGDALIIFERDLSTGLLSRRETLTEAELGTGALNIPLSVAVSPDSQLLFVAGAGGSAVTAFSRRCLPAAGACTGDDRFRLDVAWRDFAGQAGAASHLDPLGDSSRIFWFFDQNNWEMLVKVLDGCAINDRLWVFAAATTDVATELTVTDTWTGQRRDYSSALGAAAPAVTDAAAFATCDVEPARTAITDTGPIASRDGP